MEKEALLYQLNAPEPNQKKKRQFLAATVCVFPELTEKRGGCLMSTSLKKIWLLPKIGVPQNG